MFSKDLGKLFDKLRKIQKNIDAFFDSPEILAGSTLEETLHQERAVIHAIVVAVSMPELIERLKVASAAAQESRVAYARGECSLDVRNITIRAVLDRRDELIAALNKSPRDDLQVYNELLGNHPEIMTEFGIRQTSTPCAAS